MHYSSTKYPQHGMVRCARKEREGRLLALFVKTYFVVVIWLFCGEITKMWQNDNTDTQIIFSCEYCYRLSLNRMHNKAH